MIWWVFPGCHICIMFVRMREWLWRWTPKNVDCVRSGRGDGEKWAGIPGMKEVGDLLPMKSLRDGMAWGGLSEGANWRLGSVQEGKVLLMQLECFEFSLYEKSQSQGEVRISVFLAAVPERHGRAARPPEPLLSALWPGLQQRAERWFPAARLGERLERPRVPAQPGLDRGEVPCGP